MGDTVPHSGCCWQGNFTEPGPGGNLWQTERHVVKSEVRHPGVGANRALRSWEAGWVLRAAPTAIVAPGPHSAHETLWC